MYGELPLSRRARRAAEFQQRYQANARRLAQTLRGLPDAAGRIRPPDAGRSASNRSSRPRRASMVAQIEQDGDIRARFVAAVQPRRRSTRSIGAPRDSAAPACIVRLAPLARQARLGC